MLCAPVVAKLVVKAAVVVLPVPLNVPVPNVVVPSLKVTVPVGVKPATEAVNATLVPMAALAGVAFAVSVILAGAPYCVLLAELVTLNWMAVELVVLLVVLPLLSVALAVMLRKKWPPVRQKRSN